MQKIRYELDPYNRLVFEKTERKSNFPKFRKVIDGQFKIGKKNNLSYHVKTPLLKGEDIPHQVKLRGKWSLTNNHNLKVTLDKSGRETFGDKIVLEGGIIDVNKNSLLFSLTTKTKENIHSTYTLSLSGLWRADKNNRLSFWIKKEKNTCEALLFNGLWEINRKHQIVYQYEKRDLLTKKKKVHTLIFKGYWDIKDSLRISYILSERTDSVFDFKTSTGIFKENYIKYEIGIALAKRVNPIKRSVTLFGKWRPKKNKSLIFEVEYENKRINEIIFGAEVKFLDKNNVFFKLKSDVKNKDIGVTLKLSRRILKGEVFLQQKKKKKESTIYGGLASRW